MDQLLEKLDSALISSQDPQETGKTNYDQVHKNYGSLGNQEQRRKDLLDIQKSERQSKVDKCRGILSLIRASEKHDVFKEKVHYRPSIYVAGFTKTSSSYKNVLMLSEWMVEKPEDFHENWLVTPCPKGVRTLVIASDGTTKCYTKYGNFRLECFTALPGGNPHQRGRNNRCCILDCFHVDSMNTMFVLDILAWNDQPMTDGETDFRHYWLQANLEDIPGIKVLSKRNKLIFKLLPKVPCTRESFNVFMMKAPHFENYTPALDGLLFYHKLAHYFAGETPLVGWLYPYMVPEIIGPDVTVNQIYLIGKPNDYVNQADFIRKFEEAARKKEFYKKTTFLKSSPEDKYSKKTECMETETVEGTTNNDDGTENSMETEATQETPKTKRGKSTGLTMEAEILINNNEGSIEKSMDTETAQGISVNNNSESTVKTMEATIKDSTKNRKSLEEIPKNNNEESENME